MGGAQRHNVRVLEHIACVARQAVADSVHTPTRLTVGPLFSACVAWQHNSCLSHTIPAIPTKNPSITVATDPTRAEPC